MLENICAPDNTQTTASKKSGRQHQRRHHSTSDTMVFNDVVATLGGTRASSSDMFVCHLAAKASCFNGQILLGVAWKFLLVKL